MFPGGLPRCFEFILGADDLSRPFGEGTQWNQRRHSEERRIALRRVGEVRSRKVFPQEVDVSIWNAFPGPHPVPARGVRLRPHESLRERGRYFKQNIVSRHGCVARKSVGGPCAFDERKEISVRMAARGARKSAPDFAQARAR
jgi:hypothetical protein